MNESLIQSELVFTKDAKCRDCYRCLKACPVKAIKIENGQAYILQNRCIDCNICIQNCAQDAISFKSDKAKLYELLSSGKKIAVTVDASYSSICADWERERFPSALRRLGFSFVSETSVAANVVAKKTIEYWLSHPEKSHISAICPTVVNYVEKYKPEAIDNLIPVASPYIVHGRWLKEKLGKDTLIVYVGSCVAKKMEIKRPTYSGVIDLAITFAELREMFDEQNILLQTCEESNFDETPVGKSRLLPLVGSLSEIADKELNFASLNHIAVSGFQDIRNSIDLVTMSKGILVEPLFCYKGCINGPGMHIKNNIFDRRAELIEYVTSKPTNNNTEDPLIKINTDRTFSKDKIIPKPKYSTDEIRNVLSKTGDPDFKKRPNCFSCGYPTCKDKAIAVLEGMAETEMCIPHMRRLAEKKASLLLETAPNGFVVLSEQFEILSMNKAFKNLFLVSDSIIGKHISSLIDPEGFYKLATGETNMYEGFVRYEKHNLVFHQLAYKLDKNKQYVGIFINVTNSLATRTKLDNLRSTTLEQAQELLQHQIEMSQGIAKLLGEHAAQSEILINNIIKYTQGDTSNNNETNQTDLSWDMNI